MLGFTQSEEVRGAGEEDRRVCVSTFSSEWAFWGGGWVVGSEELKLSSMDTTAAAELGMLADAGGVDGVGFWDSGDVDPSSWGGEEEDEEDDAEEDFLWERAAAVVASQAAAQGPPGRQQRQSSSSAGMEPPSKKRSKPAPPDEASPGAGGRGSGSNSGKGNSQHVGGGQGFGPAGGAVGAGAVGRGRGTGSIFYKTKLCSRFRSGNCPYNTNCNFAHGMEELRKPPPGWEEFVASQELPPAMPASQSPSHGGSGGGAAGGGGGSTDSQVRFHKTRPCKKYFGEGNCPYGEKCNFLHDEQSAPRAVREARETAAPLLSTPKTESSSLSAEGPAKDALASNSAATASAAAGSITPRPLNWKTRLCNKWETTGQCPFGDKCHFAHGSDGMFCLLILPFALFSFHQDACFVTDSFSNAVCTCQEPH